MADDYTLPGIGRLFTARQFAAVVQVKPQTIRNWIHEGRLTTLKVGTRRLIAESELLRLASAGWELGGGKR
jgi:excisionase family DNA binding protein